MVVRLSCKWCDKEIMVPLHEYDCQTKYQHRDCVVEQQKRILKLERARLLEAQYRGIGE